MFPWNQIMCGRIAITLILNCSFSWISNSNIFTKIIKHFYKKEQLLLIVSDFYSLAAFILMVVVWFSSFKIINSDDCILDLDFIK